MTSSNILTPELALTLFHPNDVILHIEGFTHIAPHTFRGWNMSGVQMIGVKSISPDAFRNCPNLRQVNLCDELRFIGVNAFENCGIDLLCIPRKVKVIERGAFAKHKGAKPFEMIFFPEDSNIEEIGFDAFENAISCTTDRRIPPHIISDHAALNLECLESLHEKNKV